MFMYRYFVLVSTLTLLSLASTPVLAKDAAPDTSVEGLELVEKDRRGEIYADPDVDWSGYSKIRLDPATVAFRKNWQRDQNRTQPFKVRTEDMERIKTELSELFGEVFSEELTANGGYSIAQASGDDVLRITPHIVDLDVYAPDTRGSAGITQSYTESAGRMTLKLELYDSVTGDLIAKSSDRQEAPRRGYLQWTNSVTNRAEARRMLQRWAGDLRKRLDEARAAKPPADPA
jgi:hypothetical protein